MKQDLRFVDSISSIKKTEFDKLTHDLSSPFLNYDLKELKEMYKSKKAYFIYFDFESMNSFFILNTNKEQIYTIQKEDLSNPSSTNESLRPINL